MSVAAKRRGPRVWSPESRAKLSATNKRLGRKPPLNSQKGCKRSPEIRAKLRTAKVLDKPKRVAASKALWLDPAYKSKMATAFSRNPSRLETKMAVLLDAAGVDYVYQYPVPGTRYVADFYLPRTNTLVEVDGARWHLMRKDYDDRRDETIRALGFRVVRLSSPQVKFGVELELAVA